MSIRAVVFFAFIVALLASADKLPSTQFRCDNANVVSSLTSLPNTTIDDWNINYVSPDGQVSHERFSCPHSIPILRRF
jgi:hypothetical protein